MRELDETQVVETQTAGGETLRLHKKWSEDGKEVELQCHSKGREEKEQAMLKKSCEAFEAGLQTVFVKKDFRWIGIE
ncbi:hypothetical protein [Candidatus Symbiobacter mobilis]|uniref:hypothetical protein n=1 Tax=Candidatus Symbiobacter mobilis TaxID=1436290 RepID=UPI001930DC29|nr:hypothetical protein [Candidatus Symbiobacter mobilis]